MIITEAIRAKIRSQLKQRVEALSREDLQEVIYLLIESEYEETKLMNRSYSVNGAVSKCHEVLDQLENH